jgi:hypothetical protein
MAKLFHLAVRRWIYSMPVQDDLDGIIEKRNRSFPARSARCGSSCCQE